MTDQEVWDWALQAAAVLGGFAATTSILMLSIVWGIAQIRREATP